MTRKVKAVKPRNAWAVVIGSEIARAMFTPGLILTFTSRKAAVGAVIGAGKPVRVRITPHAKKKGKANG